MCWEFLNSKRLRIGRSGRMSDLPIFFPFSLKEIHMLFAPKERGQGLIEYALILVLVAIVVIAVLMILGPRIGNVFSSVNKSLSGV